MQLHNRRIRFDVATVCCVICLITIDQTIKFVGQIAMREKSGHLVVILGLKFDYLNDNFRSLTYRQTAILDCLRYFSTSVN
jgi:hypothetical protein